MNPIRRMLIALSRASLGGGCDILMRSVRKASGDWSVRCGIVVAGLQTLHLGCAGILRD